MCDVCNLPLAVVGGGSCALVLWESRNPPCQSGPRWGKSSPCSLCRPHHIC